MYAMYANLDEYQSTFDTVITCSIFAQVVDFYIVYQQPSTLKNKYIRGLKIPRRKACRFESGPGHHTISQTLTGV
jgi:hypothetical protein